MAQPPPPADPERFEEAVDAFRRRVPLPEPLWRKLQAEERRRAFWVAWVTQARAVQELKDAVERAIRDGTTLEDFRQDARALVEEAWGAEDSPRLETVFRTNVMGAYNAGRQEVFTDPEVMESRPYLRFDAAGDSRMTDICEELDGTVLPADDPFWRTHTPPLHFNCRSMLTPLTAEEAEEEGVAPEKPETRADSGFGHGPEPEDAEPDLTSFDPDIRSVLRERLEDEPA